VKFLPIAALCLCLCSACGGQPAVNDSFAANVSEVEVVPASQTSAASAAPRDLLGRWTGVEGMFLQVSAGARPGTYRLEMQSDLETKTVVEGRAEGNTISFQRGGETRTLRPTDGAATGLKYLAGKTDCLTVAPGEGYCRD
jgi:hypothetical protein